MRDSREAGQWRDPHFQVQRTYIEVPEPPTIGDRVKSTGQMIRRNALPFVAGAAIGGVAAVGVGINRDWLLTPANRDRGRRVVWEQREEDLRAKLQNELPKLHNSPEIWVGAYPRRQDHNFILSFVSQRRYENNISFFLAQLHPKNPGEFRFTNSRFVNARGTYTIPQAVYEQKDGTKIEAYSNSNFDLLRQGVTEGLGIKFFDFEDLSGFDPSSPSLGYMAVLIPLNGNNVPRQVGERFVFLFQRQKANGVWIPNVSLSAFEIAKNVFDPVINKVTEGEHYIFVSWLTFDPKKPKPIQVISRNGVPLTPKEPPVDAVALVITDKKGKVTESAQLNTPTWGDPGFLLDGLTVNTSKEVPAKRIR